MARHAKTLTMLDVAVEVLTETHPMTVRQVYYQLVSRQGIDNNRGQYQAVSHLLVGARRDGTIPWEWIEDRLRHPRAVTMWDDVPDFLQSVRRSYRRDVWPEQPEYLEVWLEKDALSGIFEEVLNPYGVTLNVGRGFDGWDSIHNAAARYAHDDDVTVLYYGDFDPSGEDMVRSLRDRLGELNSEPEIIKCALTLDDIQRYNLPPDFTKATDTRSAKFVAKYGDVAVELDALPVSVLRARLIADVEDSIDLDALRRTRRLERDDQTRLLDLLKAVDQDAT